MDKEKIRGEMKEFMKEKKKPLINTSLIEKKQVEENKTNQKHPLYFEGQLQIRNSSPEMEKFIEKRVEKAQEGIAKKTKFKDNSYNYNISNRRLIHKIAFELRERFGGTIKESPKLFSYDKQRSKNIYRLNVLYIAPKYSIGDVVLMNNYNEPFKVTKYDKSEICLEGLKTSKRTKAREEDINNKFETINTKIISLRPEITALGKDYQPKTIYISETKKATNTKEPKEGMNLKAVEYKDLLYPIKPKLSHN